MYIDPARVEEFVTALGVEPTEGYRAEIGAEVPPGFFMYVTTYGAAPIHDVLGFEMLRTVFGGSVLETFSPARVGETLRVVPEVTSRVVKDGRSGQLTFVEITATYTREDGSVVLVERSNTVERS